MSPPLFWGFSTSFLSPKTDNGCLLLLDLVLDTHSAGKILSSRLDSNRVRPHHRYKWPPVLPTRLTTPHYISITSVVTLNNDEASPMRSLNYKRMNATNSFEPVAGVDEAPSILWGKGCASPPYSTSCLCSTGSSFQEETTALTAFFYPPG